MEVDEEPVVPGPSNAAAAAVAAGDPPSVLAASGVVGSVSVSLHPLVIMNISEHWTRTKAQNGAATNDVFGALIGKQSGRNIEIMNSFELDFSRIDGSVVIFRDYYDLKESQFKQIFPDMDFLGEYAAKVSYLLPVSGATHTCVTCYTLAVRIGI